MRNTLGFLFAGAMLASAITTAGCGGDVTNSNNDDMGGAGDMAVAAVNPCGTGTICTNDQIATQTLELFKNSQATVKVQAAPGYSGMVKATFERSAIDKLSGGADPFVSIVAVPGIFALSADQPVNLFLKFGTTTDAAAFTDQTITLHLADATDPTKSFDLPFKMTVNPTLTITYSGDGTTASPAMWSTDQLTNKLLFNVRQRAVTNMKGGTTFIFVNKDTNSHEIHGDAPIIHQAQTGYNTAPNPTSNQAATPPNGIYQLNAVNDPTGTNNAGYYFHNRQQGAATNNETRVVKFIP